MQDKTKKMFGITVFLLIIAVACLTGLSLLGFKIDIIGSVILCVILMPLILYAIYLDLGRKRK